MVLKKTDILDNTMKEILSDFLKKEADSSKSPQVREKFIKQELTSIFFDTKLNDINKSYVLKLISTHKFSVITQRFLLYLCQNNYLTAQNDLRIIEAFEQPLFTTFRKDYFRYILTSDIAENFIKLYPNAQKAEYTVFFLDIGNIEFKSIDLKECAIRYINHKLKLDPKTTISDKNTKIREFRNICKNFISKIQSNELTRKVTAYYLSMDWIRTNTINVFSDFIIYMESLNKVYDKELYRVSVFKKDLPALSKDKYKILLETPLLDRFFIRKIHVRLLLMANTDNIEIREALKKYAIQSTYSSASFTTFLQDFQNSLSGLDVYGIYDFSLETLLGQVKYYNNIYHDKHILSFLSGFYVFISSNYNPEIFKNDGFDVRNLQTIGLCQLLASGFEIINLNPIETVPDADKWILCYSDKFASNSGIKTSNTKIVDFTKINNKIYRFWCKYFIWKSTNSLSSKLNSMNIFVMFFNYIDDLKSGKILSLYTKKNDLIDISVNEIVAYRNYIITSYQNNRTILRHIYDTRAILKFIQDNNIAEFPSGIYYYLTYKLNNKYDNTKAIPDEKLKQLSAYMNNKSTENSINELFYLAFYIALETEFRPSQIFSLRIDCVSETAKKNEFIITSKTKTSANEPIEQPITIYVKKHIDRILALTQKYRAKNSIADISSYLFLMPSDRKNEYKIITPELFNTYLKNCCKELNLPLYTCQNLRDTHMTKAEEFVIRNQLSDMEQNILSGHRSPNVDTKHYIDTQIKDLLESVHGVIIGDIDISGHIHENLPADIKAQENCVSNGCGYCNSKNCENFSFLDCLLCKDFVTTVDRLPYFQEQVKILDKKIKSATIPHDKEDFVNIKRLYLGFIQQILEIKGGIK